MSPTDSFPLELWEKIFSEACTDGGLTGRSLALTCRSFHTVSAPFRLKSVLLESFNQCQIFLASIETAPARLKSVRYLYVSFIQDMPIAQRLWLGTGLPPGMGQSVDEVMNYGDPRQLLVSLVSSVSTTLVTLTLLFPRCLSMDLWGGDVHFPALKELTFSGAREHLPASVLGAQYPSLEHLHIMGDMESIACLDTILKGRPLEPPPPLLYVRVLLGTQMGSLMHQNWDAIGRFARALTAVKRAQFQLFERVVHDVNFKLDRPYHPMVECSKFALIHGLSRGPGFSSKVTFLANDAWPMDPVEYWDMKFEEAKRDWLETVSGGMKSRMDDEIGRSQRDVHVSSRSTSGNDERNV